MEEVMIMEALMARLQDWRHLLTDILEPALVLRSHSTVVDVCSLLRALKVGCSGCVPGDVCAWVERGCVSGVVEERGGVVVGRCGDRVAA
jgi:hypothetical protein